uniref:Uncharacterized protein n=1 Tax=Arundo donax TaxID=35708 RepID=A0A0A9BZX7_ARUDO
MKRNYVAFVLNSNTIGLSYIVGFSGYFFVKKELISVSVMF